MKEKDGIEKRKARRRPVLNSFSIFLVVPKKGVHRLVVHDLSEGGIGFDADTEGETPEDFPVSEGESMDIRFYMNPSLYIPINVDVVRVERRGSVRRVGAQFSDKNSRNYKALHAFIQMLDSIIDVVQLEPQG